MALENESEIIPKDDVPDDVHRPKHVACLHKNEFSFFYNTVVVFVCLYLVYSENKYRLRISLAHVQ